MPNFILHISVRIVKLYPNLRCGEYAVTFVQAINKENAMRKLGVKLSAFDLLHWVNEQTSSSDIFEQGIVRNTLVNLMDLYDHWCRDENDCAVCQRPEGAYVRNQTPDPVLHAKALEESNRKYAELSARFEKSGIDLSFLYSAILSPESHTVIRSSAHQGVIDDFGNMRYSRRSAFAVLGSSIPVIIKSEGFGANGFDGAITLTVFLETHESQDTNGIESTLAANELVSFIKESLESTRIGDIEIPTCVERVRAEVFALGGVRDDERDIVNIETHIVTNANKSHPVLGRMASPDSFWLIASEGAGRSINEAFRVILDTKDDPSLTTEEAVKLASIVFSKRGVQPSVSP